MILEKKVILAIESAIDGGSISLIRDGHVVESWVGSDSVSKAEDLLPNIDNLLTSNNIALREIGTLAVSAGPGSFTGIRIGIATALGLSRSLEIELKTISVLKAMAFCNAVRGDSVAVVPVGRNAVCIQSFRKQNSEITELDKPQTIREDVFFDYLAAETGKTFILHASLFNKAVERSRLVNFGTNLAFAIGSLCLHQPAAVEDKPLFIAKSF